MISAHRLRELLDYNQATGEFYWRIAGRGRSVGAAAGCIQNLKKQRLQYRLIKIEGVAYKAHRLAWLHVTGEWPPGDLDHANRDGLDNAWSNLRVASKSQNRANARLQRNNSAGYKGVIWNGKLKRWKATIKSLGKTTHLGFFATAQDAHAAYCRAAEREFGEFARAG